MTTVQPEQAQPSADELAERLLTGAITTMETLSVHLGVALGLYRALADGPADARDVAERAGVHPRYTREWLEQQAVAGFVQVLDTEADAYARRFRLPDGYREVLVDEDSPTYLGTLPGLTGGFGAVLPDLVEAYRTGGGVAYEAYGELTRHGIGGVNRPMFRSELSDWVAALPDVRAQLEAGPSNVLDLGCGIGASSIALAEMFPQARVRGVDLDAASVANATESVSRLGLSDRVAFERADAASLTAVDEYQFVCIFEALHDMADPVAALRAVRDALAPGGAVLIADERVTDEFAAPGDLVERLTYGFSVLHCLPATRAEGSAVEAGTVLRPDTVREYAKQAGLTCTVLPIDNDLWRFYRLDAA